MKNILKRFWAGMCWSPRYGDHPGTPVLLVLLAVGFAATLKSGPGRVPWWSGGLIMAVIFGPFYLMGCWERGGPDRLTES